MKQGKRDIIRLFHKGSSHWARSQGSPARRCTRPPFIQDPGLIKRPSSSFWKVSALVAECAGLEWDLPSQNSGSVTCWPGGLEQVISHSESQFLLSIFVEVREDMCNILFSV